MIKKERDTFIFCPCFQTQTGIYYLSTKKDKREMIILPISLFFSKVSTKPLDEFQQINEIITTAHLIDI